MRQLLCLITIDLILCNSASIISFTARPVITKPSSRKEDPYKVWTSLNKPFSVNVSFYSNIPYSEAVVYKVDESVYLTRATDVFIQTKEDIVDLPVYGKLIKTWGYTHSLTYTMTQVEDFGVYLIKIPNEIGTSDFYLKIVHEGKLNCMNFNLLR